MIINLCIACKRVNAVDARRCVACGARLDDAGASRNQLSGGAIWLDDLVASTDKPPESAHAEVPAEPEVSLTLRKIEPLLHEPAPAVAAKRRPDIEEFIVSDPEPRPPLDAPDVEWSPTPPKAAAAGSGKKAERRAAVRRRRLRDRPAVGTEIGVPEVLVLDPDDGERSRLHNLLVKFGFGVHAVDRAEKALPLAASRHFVAAFVDVALDASDGGAGIDLCQQLREHVPGQDDHTLIVLVSGALRPTQRVRAQLAGCDEVIAKPVTRGSVAGVLDGKGIVLPADPRRC